VPLGMVRDQSGGGEVGTILEDSRPTPPVLDSGGTIVIV
jgi:hypothetical protein